MIWITGDTHGDFYRLSTAGFPEQRGMTKEDYVIILGDFGGVWAPNEETPHEKWWLDWIEDKPFTTLFIDGNHENHERLAKYPKVKFHGGYVHKIRPSVLHLMRGGVFELNGATFWAFGGASSHDIKDGVLDPVLDADKIREWRYDYNKLFRINRVSWWEEELPNKWEMINGAENLVAAGNKVDYIITHSPSASVLALLGDGLYEQDRLTKYLEDIRSRTEYKKHFFGHMHIDRTINDKDIGLYEQIIRIV